MTTATAYHEIGATNVRSASRISPLSAVVVAGLAVLGAVYAYIPVVLDAPMFLLIGTALAGVLAAVALTGKKWAAIPAVVLVTVNLGMEGQNIANWHLHDVEHGQAFAAGVVVLPIASMAVISAGIAFTVQSFRSGTLALPRWAQATAVLAIGAAVGGSMVAQAPHYGPPARVSAAAIESLEPAVVMADMKFAQTDLTATVGETSTWRIANADNQEHTFDIPGLDIHMTVGAGESGLVMFAPAKAGTYTFKCSIPGHTKMKGVLTVQ